MSEFTQFWTQLQLKVVFNFKLEVASAVMNDCFRTRFLGACVLGLCLSACGSDDDPADSNAPSQVGDAMSGYAEIVSASYEDSVTAALELQDAVESFLADPSEAGLEAAREAWLAAREPYLQTEVYRFYSGPIDDDDGPEGTLNAWPMDEAYVDYVEGDAAAGIINDTSIALDADELLSLNQSDGEETISTGFHAIEFLLWGQDQSADGPGNRPYTDFVEGADGTAANQDRRKEYLGLVTTLLVEQLQGLVGEWKADDAGNYRAEFESADSDDQLLRVLTGMTILSGFETGGERLQTALDSGEQEDEHSCFSDNTHRDMVQDVQGVLNVWTGSYTRRGGDELSFPGVRDVVAEKDAALAAELDEQIAESLRLANELEPPFDQEIASDNEEGQARVTALVTSLREQAHLLEDVARAFGFDAPMAP